MSADPLVLFCEAVLAVLRRADLGEPHEASWGLRTSPLTLDDLATLRLSVLPAGRMSSRSLARAGSEQVDYDVAVAVERRTDGSAADVQRLLGVVRQVIDLFAYRALPDCPLTAWCVGWSNQPALWAEELEVKRLFRSVVVLIFRAGR